MPPVGPAETAARRAEDCALVILSCDDYRDLWAPCLALYRRYWPDCPYPMYLVSESARAEDPRVRALPVGPGLAWSNVARAALSALPQPDVLLMLDDFLLTGPVASGRVESRRATLHALGGACLRLVPRPRPNARVRGHPGIGEHEPGAPFRASLQASIWDRRTLLGLLRPGESPWDFERDGSARTTAIGAGFFATWRATLPYMNAIVRGRWTIPGRRLCRREGLRTEGARPDVSLAWRLRAPIRHLELAPGGPVVRRLRRALGLRLDGPAARPPRG